MKKLKSLVIIIFLFIVLILTILLINISENKLVIDNNSELYISEIMVTNKNTYSGVMYNPRFNVSLIMVIMVTTIVMVVIGSNISVSLGDVVERVLNKNNTELIYDIRFKKISNRIITVTILTVFFCVTPCTTRVLKTLTLYNKNLFDKIEDKL